MMIVTECLKEIMDTQTLILLYLDSLRKSSGSPGSTGIPAIAKTCRTDKATVRRKVKGDGKRHPCEKSLLGRGLVIEVEGEAGIEYMITEKGHAEVCGIRSEVKKAVGEAA